MRSRHRTRLASRRLGSESLERRDMLSASAHAFEFCDIPQPLANQVSFAASQFAAPQFPLADTFKLHSLLTATKRIYLDFDGHYTTNTTWQNFFGYNDIDTPAFSLDPDYTTFSDAEKAAIQDIWARVTEDFLPFEVDVTTEDPGIDGLLNTGGSDTFWGIRVVVGGNGAWLGGASGIAIKGGFGQSDGSPAFVFADQSWKTNAASVAQCISHETGHTLGLSHDGPGYYGGHGTGATSWVPIMGSGNKSLDQWSKGEYNSASNQEDDLAIITTTAKNGFGFRADDHSDTIATATVVPGTTATGIIEKNTDVDLFAFTSTGTISVTIAPAALGANLDILAEILDAGGTVVKTSNPTGAIDASFNFAAAAGTYYLRVQGTGEGDPLATGYTKYASLGQYTVTLNGATPPTPVVPTLSISDLTLTEGNSGSTSGFVTITLSQPSTQSVTVNWAPRDGTATRADNDYSFPPASGGTTTFQPGQTSFQIDVLVVGDTKVEPNETFDIVLSSPVNATIADSTGTITIVNDDSATTPPTLAIASAAADLPEGTGAGSTAFTFTVTRSGDLTGTSSVAWAVTGSGAIFANAADFAGSVLPSGTVTFAGGDATKTITVDVAADATTEVDEGFTVTLSTPSGATLGTPVAATGTIRNDDLPTGPASVFVDDITVGEGTDGVTTATFTIQLTVPRSSGVSVRYASLERTAMPRDKDYRSVAGTVFIPAGETSVTVPVTIIGDAKYEADERFAFRIISATGVPISRSIAYCTIVNDDPVPVPVVNVSDVRLTEGQSSRKLFAFIVSLSERSPVEVSVGYQTADVTATAGLDYTATSGTLRFMPGVTKRSVSVWVTGDIAFEATEQFALELFSPSGATLGRSTGIGTILNDDKGVPSRRVTAAAFAVLAAEESLMTPTTRERRSARRG